MATSTVLEVDTTQSLLCLIPRLIMLDNTYYFLYAPETRIKKTRESTYSKPKTGTRFYLNRATGQRQKRMPPKHCMNLVYKKNKFSGRCYANDP
jgi:hypothetical protein